jgi:hypothetical protein
MPAASYAYASVNGAIAWSVVKKYGEAIALLIS